MNSQAPRATPRRLWLLTALACLAAPSIANAATALVGATVHPVSGPPIENGVVLIRDGLIEAVGGRDVPVRDAEVIDLSGKHVYPSLIASYTQLGLVEIEAVRSTRDFAAAGSINPNAHAHKAFNPDSELIPVTRSNGVLVALVAPTGGRVAGCSSVMQLAGWTWEDMLLEPDVGLHINWPAERRGGDSSDDGSNALRELEQLLDQAGAYAAERGARAKAGVTEGPVDLRLEALGPVAKGETPAIITANNQAQIESAVAFCVRCKLKMILHGGHDAPRCADLLIAHDVPVIVGGVYRVPARRHEPYDHPYTLPARLHEAGVTFCVTGDSRDQSSNVRNLPYHAATAAAYGLPHDEALKSITLYPAQILGIADWLGSLEPGKHATLFVTTGDPLEFATQVERAFVQGEEVDLNDRHKSLYNKFKRRIDAASAP